MFVKHWYGIKYTTELNLCRSTLFSKTYYTILVSSGVDFEPHPNRYPSDSFGYLLKYQEVSSTKNKQQWKFVSIHYKIFYNCEKFISNNSTSENLCPNTTRFSNCVNKHWAVKFDISTTVLRHQLHHNFYNFLQIS